MKPERALKVCVVVQNHVSAVMGGAEYQAHLVAQELASRAGVEVTYLARDAVETGEQLPYSVQQVGDGRGIRRRAVAFDAPQLWAALERLRPDLIYQRMKQSYAAVCALYAQRFGVPCFLHLASDQDLEYRRRRGRLSLNFPFDVIEGMAGNWGLKRSTGVIAQTARQAQLLRQRFGIEPLEIVGNFQPLPAALPDRASGVTRVLWVSNMKELKRPELFVELAAAFAARSDFQFIMVGKPSSDRRIASVLSVAQRLPNLRYLGAVPLEEVNSLMAQAAIFINTSRYEGFPNTFIQAWSRGAVVVSLDVDIDGGMEELGVGFCARSFERLRQVVEMLAADADRRRAIATAAFHYVHQRHSMRNLSRLADLLLQPAH